MCALLSGSSQTRSRSPPLAAVWPTCHHTSRRREETISTVILQRGSEVVFKIHIKVIMCYLSWALQVLTWHRQGGDKHGDTAQHEDRPHEAAHTPQKDGPKYKLWERVNFHGIDLGIQQLRWCEKLAGLSTCVYGAAEPAARYYRGSLHMLQPWRRPKVF